MQKDKKIVHDEYEKKDKKRSTPRDEDDSDDDDDDKRNEKRFGLQNGTRKTTTGKDNRSMRRTYLRILLH